METNSQMRTADCRLRKKGSVRRAAGTRQAGRLCSPEEKAEGGRKKYEKAGAESSILSQFALILSEYGVDLSEFACNPSGFACDLSGIAFNPSELK